jgi:hypothetical protein
MFIFGRAARHDFEQQELSKTSRITLMFVHQDSRAVFLSWQGEDFGEATLGSGGASPYLHFFK